MEKVEANPTRKSWQVWRVVGAVLIVVCVVLSTSGRLTKLEPNLDGGLPRKESIETPTVAAIESASQNAGAGSSNVNMKFEDVSADPLAPGFLWLNKGYNMLAGFGWSDFAASQIGAFTTNLGVTDQFGDTQAQIFSVPDQCTVTVNPRCTYRAETSETMVGQSTSFVTEQLYSNTIGGSLSVSGNGKFLFGKVSVSASASMQFGNSQETRESVNAVREKRSKMYFTRSRAELFSAKVDWSNRPAGSNPFDFDPNFVGDWAALNKIPRAHGTAGRKKSLEFFKRWGSQVISEALFGAECSSVFTFSDETSSQSIASYKRTETSKEFSASISASVETAGGGGSIAGSVNKQSNQNSGSQQQKSSTSGTSSSQQSVGCRGMLAANPCDSRLAVGTIAPRLVSVTGMAIEEVGGFRSKYPIAAEHLARARSDLFGKQQECSRVMCHGTGECVISPHLWQRVGTTSWTGVLDIMTDFRATCLCSPGSVGDTCEKIDLNVKHVVPVQWVDVNPPPNKENELSCSQICLRSGLVPIGTSLHPICSAGKAMWVGVQPLALPSKCSAKKIEKCLCGERAKIGSTHYEWRALKTGLDCSTTCFGIPHGGAVEIPNPNPSASPKSYVCRFRPNHGWDSNYPSFTTDHNNGQRCGGETNHVQCLCSASLPFATAPVGISWLTYRYHNAHSPLAADCQRSCASVGLDMYTMAIHHRALRAPTCGHLTKSGALGRVEYYSYGGQRCGGTINYKNAACGCQNPTMSWRWIANGKKESCPILCQRHGGYALHFGQANAKTATLFEQKYLCRFHNPRVHNWWWPGKQSVLYEVHPNTNYKKYLPEDFAKTCDGHASYDCLCTQTQTFMAGAIAPRPLANAGVIRHISGVGNKFATHDYSTFMMCEHPVSAVFIRSYKSHSGISVRGWSTSSRTGSLVVNTHLTTWTNFVELSYITTCNWPYQVQFTKVTVGRIMQGGAGVRDVTHDVNAQFYWPLKCAAGEHVGTIVGFSRMEAEHSRSIYMNVHALRKTGPTTMAVRFYIDSNKGNPKVLASTEATVVWFCESSRMQGGVASWSTSVASRATVKGETLKVPVTYKKKMACAKPQIMVALSLVWSPFANVHLIGYPADVSDVGFVLHVHVPWSNTHLRGVGYNWLAACPV